MLKYLVVQITEGVSVPQKQSRNPIHRSKIGPAYEHSATVGTPVLYDWRGWVGGRPVLYEWEREAFETAKSVIRPRGGVLHFYASTDKTVADVFGRRRTTNVELDQRKVDCLLEHNYVAVAADVRTFRPPRDRTYQVGVARQPWLGVQHMVPHLGPTNAWIITNVGDYGVEQLLRMGGFTLVGLVRGKTGELVDDPKKLRKALKVFRASIGALAELETRYGQRGAEQEKAFHQSPLVEAHFGRDNLSDLALMKRQDLPHANG